MKRITMKLFLMLLSLATVFTLVGCNNEPEHVLTNAYSTPAQISYSNMRPTYNYYLTSFSFQTLELYADGTYTLSVSYSQFSALVIPEEGNDAVGNERANYIIKYYGTFTSEVDALDSETTNVTLSVPSRVVNVLDQVAFYDTDNWTDEMSAIELAVPGSQDVLSYNQESYLSANQFEETTIAVSEATYSFSYVTLVFPS